MYKSITILLAIAAAVSAETVTTSLYLVGFDQQPLVGSVIASDKTATTYSIACSDPDSDDCGMPTSFTFTQGPSTLHFDYTLFDNAEDNETIERGCTFTSSMGGSCSETVMGVAQASSTSSMSTVTFANESDLGGQHVTITAGLTAAVTTAASTTGKSAATSTSTSKGGVPRVTGAAQWVVGAAGALALAAL